MNEYDAILWEKWEAAKEPDEIIGYWAEDNNPYTIRVPAQLRNMIVEMQNCLADRRTEMVHYKDEAEKIETIMNKIFENRTKIRNYGKKEIQ